jgi:tRNA 2-thiouridine synthesizing protein A
VTTSHVTIDARGMRCPWPALRLARAIRGGAREIDVLADDPIAPGELAAVASATGFTIETQTLHRFRVFAA